MESRRVDGTRKKVLSLKDACLKSVSSNLSRYNEVFSTTDNPDLKTNLEYLRRFHSSYLVKKNLIRYKLNTSYLDFLINEYLEEVDFSIFKKRDITAALRRTVQVGHAFKTVQLSDVSFLGSEEGMNFVHEVIRSIPNVEILILNENCNDSTLEMIASSCLELRELTICGDSFSNEGLKYLCRGMKNGAGAKGPSLTALCLGCEDDYCNEGVEFLLRNMPSLENVEYTYLADVLYRMHKDVKNISQRKYNLLSLDMSYIHSDHITDALAVITEVCPRLRRFCLSGTTRGCLDLITKLSELEDLDIAGGNLDGADCSSFLECRGEGLRKLRMCRLQISADTLVQSCSNVEILQMEELTFRPLKGQRSVPAPLCRLRQLTLEDLNLKDNPNLESVTEILKSSSNLEELRISDCKFENLSTAADMIKSCDSSSLQQLVFLRCGIQKASLKTALSTWLDLEKTRLIVTNKFRYSLSCL